MFPSYPMEYDGYLEDNERTQSKTELEENSESDITFNDHQPCR